MNQHKTISAYAIEWLTTATPTVLDHSVCIEKLPYPIPPELGNAWVDSLALRDGVVLFHAVHEMEPAPAGQLIHLINVSLNPEAPIFGAQIWTSGLGCHREYWHGRDRPPVDIVAGPGRDTFRHHRGWQASIHVVGGQTSVMRSVVMPQSVLDWLLGADLSADLLRCLDLAALRPTAVHAMPSHVSANLLGAMSDHVSGQARKLYAQARLLDYLVALLAHVSNDKTIRKERQHKGRIRDLHDHLVHLEGRLPTLGDLAKQFDLPARRLNEEFVAEYGTSVYNFMTDYRLKDAHASILASKTPLKIIAARLGYSHVNHFINAFKRKFGYPPGSLRRK